MTAVCNKERRFLTAGAIWKSPFLDFGAHRAPLQFQRTSTVIGNKWLIM